MLCPSDEKDLSEAVAAATGPLRIVGGGTRPIGRPVAGEVLSVAGLSGITLYDPGALTLVAQAGTPLAEIEAALAVENQRLAFEPMDHRTLLGTSGTPTIGGVVAANVSGPRRVQVGACRDYLLGVRFVDGVGTVLKNGGRVMKNVTGYDLVKLMAGSWGTLGVLSEVAFKVLPKPDVVNTVVLSGLSDDTAGAAMRAALASPFDVTGAAHDPKPGNEPVTSIRIEGFAKSVAYRTDKLKELLRAYTDDIDTSDDPAGWNVLRNAGPLTGAGDVWRVSAKPTDGPKIAHQVKAKEHYFDWGGGLIWVLVPEGTDVRASLAGLAGHATLVRGSTATRAALPVFHPEPVPLAALSAGLRAKFDPRGILNPGLMG